MQEAKSVFRQFQSWPSMLVLTRNMVRLRKSTDHAEAVGVPLIKESKKKVERFLGERNRLRIDCIRHVRRQRGCSIVNS